MKFLPPDKNISKLNERFKKKVFCFLSEVSKMGVFVTEARRSKARQKYLIWTGSSRTNTSYHQSGLAIDIAFKDDTRTKQKERELYPEDMKRWREVADIAKKYGIDWGYDLWNWDKPHFQDNGKEYLEKINQQPMTDKQKRAVQACDDLLHFMWASLPKEGKNIAADAAKEFRHLLK